MDKQEKFPLLVILGPTATGKTNLAVQISNQFKGEIISADSRQIYKGMDVGTGKDKDEYFINGIQIPYHLIDILNPEKDYSVFHFQQDFNKVYNEIAKRKSFPVLCGGTGLYIESILLNYEMKKVDPDNKLREDLEKEEHEKLIKMLKKINLELHNTSDLSSKKRTIRALEIGLNIQKNGDRKLKKKKDFNYCVIGISPDREIVKSRISDRLKFRLKNGMIDEVENLLKNGMNPDRLNYFGLEYKFIGQFLSGKLNYNDMFQKLNTAIHQFSKRQMTFFRRMEKRGIKINWVKNAEMSSAKNILVKYFQG